jgi:tRNA1Val (adenine37-N6)-methyltransferase
MTRATDFLDGRLRLEQPARGYRFSLDAPILADFLQFGPDDVLLEIGTGVGIIPLILFVRRPFQRIYAVEVQPRLVELAQRNVRANHAQESIRIIRADIRDPQLPGVPERVDAVFANPPYRRVGEGLLNPDPERAAARHELLLDLPSLMRSASRRLGDDGQLCLTHLPGREPEVTREAARRGFHLLRRREVFSFPGDPQPFLVLLHWARKPGAPQTLPPLHVYAAEKEYSAEFRRIISASGSDDRSKERS